MPFGIRPSNVRVCHSTTRALLVRASKLSAVHSGWQVSFLFVILLVLLIVIETRIPCGSRLSFEHEHDHERKQGARMDQNRFAHSYAR
jgi:hypothetical protein